jgi:stage V sporulation protein G
MEITDVKVIPVDDEKLKAFVSIVFDQSFVVTDIKIINGPKGLFVSMPSKKRKDGTFKDIAHPLNNQMRQYLEDKILTVYRQQVAGAQGSRPSAGASPAGGPPEGGRREGQPQQGQGRPGSGTGSEGNGGSGGEAPQS